MYIPHFFEEKNKKVLVNFIKENGFGILFSQNEGKPYATHLPFFIDENGNEDEVLYAHMAKSNAHWEQIKDEVLVVFQGPHSYISSTWYEVDNTVPTWNYVTVHVYGEFSIINDREKEREILNKTVQFYDLSIEYPLINQENQEFMDGLIDSIVCFKIKINKIEGKWKLSQNHKEERKRKVITSLKQSKEANANKIANLMENSIKDI